MLYLIAPAFNEGSKIRHFVAEALRIGRAVERGFQLVLVDDGSRDNSVEILDELAREGSVTLLRHERNRGIAATFTTGIRHALSRCGDNDAIGVIESDGSNDLSILPDMLGRLDDGADAVIASRNIGGGRYEGFPLSRLFLSRFGNFLFRSLVSVPGVTDYTIFFRLYRAGALRPLFRSDESPFLFPDFSANTELLLRLAQLDRRFDEVPHRYRYDRKDSASKLRVFRNTWQSLRLIARYRKRRDERHVGSEREPSASLAASVIVGLLALIQLLLAGLAFENPSDILRDVPILSYDHFAHVFIADYIGEAWRASRDLWAFLPDWFAGAHLTGFLEAQGPLVLAGVLTGFRHMAFWLQATFFLFAALMPIALYRGFRHYGMGVQTALAATCLGFLYFIGYFPAFLGLVGDSASALALYGSIYFYAVFWRFVSSGGKAAYFRLLILLPVYVLTHKSTVIIIVPVAMAFYAAYWREWSARIIWKSLIVAGVVFAVNAYWILPAPAFAPFMTTDASPFYKDAGFRQLAFDFFSTTVYFPPWEHRGMAGLLILRWLILVAGVWGLRAILLCGEKRLFAALAGAIAYCAFVAYASDWMPALRELKPLRLVVPLNLLLLAAAGIAVERMEILDGLERRFRHRYRKTLAAGAAITVIAFCFGSMFKIRLAIEPLRTRFPEEIVELRNWIVDSTDTSGRILFEQWKEMPDASQEPAHQLHAGAFLPRGRLYANGFHPIVYSRFAYPDFASGVLLGEPIESLSDERLTEYFRVYNVKWVIAWTPKSISRLDRYAMARRERARDGFVSYSLDRVPNWFLAGSGDLDAATDVIRLRNVKAEDGHVIISFHHVPYLAAEGVELRRAPLIAQSKIEDPLGFMEAIDPPRDFEIRKNDDWR